MRRKLVAAIGLATTAALLTACGGSDNNKTTASNLTHGEIKIWYSNNPQEVAWGKQAVAAWNSAHPT